ncbi:hypothetical protein PHYSODRAFT_324374 [Phytophthora sojae]|uniref:Uncharacterized protein n=1 Tax=Phytophthora sojae (strain P6497) TaxID=1094619 RepID=G4YUV8_PHYSP|nr:hypothetical protein PHYSODRAFT_324374 [Phytophthora sojae]EGZ23124.1 hypothetical protein PHYSODRAFT_324374 [Phytophthora sojae]|eukprot:XP_009518412.1 hypothetical protein PHYSODRAFT_324374 [Phytophthora sojae]
MFMLAYIIGRKSTRAYREGLQQNGLTSFEVATGAALTNRFGVISSYDNYAVHDNQLIATIDAVYCNGFLVLTRVRFTNIFVHEMDKNTVKETSMLVYPTTIAWSDLLHLDVTALS